MIGSGLTKKLYIHAGGTKTGSSAIINFLTIHAEELRKLGFFYKVIDKLNHDWLIIRGNGYELINCLLNYQSIDSIVKLFAGYLGDSKNGIISTEEFQFLEMESILLLSEAASRLDAKIEFIYFVRNVDNFFISSYDQLIKRHGEWRDIEEWLLTVTKYDHAVFLKNAIKVIPRSQIQVIHYDSVSKKIIDAMIKALGIENFSLTKVDFNKKKVNRSLTAKERELMRLFNKKFGDKFSTEMSDFLIYNSPELKSEPPFLSDTCICHLKKMFQEDVNWINETFFDGKEILKVESPKLIDSEGYDYKNVNKIDPCMTIINWALEKISSLIHHVTEIEISLYISELADGTARPYGEARSATTLYEVNGRRQNLELVLPEDLAPLLRLRLDIATAPVAVRLHGLELVQADGSTLWRWAGDCESLLQQSGVICLPAGGGVWLLSLNNDPQFELAIPDSVLAQVGPRARLLVEMTPQRLEEALPEFIGALQKQVE
jgi:hypothetical protein